MRTFTTIIDIAAPPARVWAIMADVERWADWTASITSVERLDEGPMGVGSRARVRQPKLSPAVFEVTEWNPDRGFVWAMAAPGIRGIGRHVIEPVGLGASRVTLSVEFDGLLSGVMAWLYGGLTRRYIRLEAEGLKRRAEA